MITPKKGDVENVPLNANGKAVASQWDPVADQNSGELCKAYGAPAIMRVPGRIRVTWEDPNTLRLDTDAGEQVRRFSFRPDAAKPTVPTRQGNSTARWMIRPLDGDNRNVRVGALRVDTSGLTPGYLRSNGIPYSADAKVTEIFNVVQFEGQALLVVTTTVEDPAYLSEPLINSVQFKKEDKPKWLPRPCELPTPLVSG